MYIKSASLVHHQISNQLELSSTKVAFKGGH